LAQAKNPPPPPPAPEPEEKPKLSEKQKVPELTTAYEGQSGEKKELSPEIQNPKTTVGSGDSSKNVGAADASQK